uniref:Ig-like domain-containing protein n=1 Tax=Kryptolebias marmoratus TaxID=37003 RepID=A0A3Q3B2Z3_KRYMA
MIAAGFLLLAAGLNAVLAENKYFEIGGELSFQPAPLSERITSITWKLNGDMVAEWIEGAGELEYFRDFRGRSNLDLITGVLVISSMRKTDEGDFTVEINNKVQSVVYSAKGIKSLHDTQVEVVVRPLTCDHNSEKCTLSCIVDITDAGPVQYFWKQGEGEWKESQEDLVITNNEETRQIKTFSCNMKNPISEKESGPLDNPFNKQPPGGSNGPLVGGIIVLVSLVLAGGGLAGVAYKHPEKVAPCIPLTQTNMFVVQDGSLFKLLKQGM